MRQSGKIAWIDKNRKSYSLEEISDLYLLNILRHIKNGGGWMSFLSEDRINDLYDESIRRGLSFEFKRSEVNSGFLKRLDEEYSDIQERYLDDIFGR